jgi:hypothetical protein
VKSCNEFRKDQTADHDNGLSDSPMMRGFEFFPLRVMREVMLLAVIAGKLIP